MKVTVVGTKESRIPCCGKGYPQRELLSRTIKDGRVVSLINKYLRAGAMNKGKWEETALGLV